MDAPWAKFEGDHEVAAVSGNHVNVRAGPSVNYRTLDQLRKGTLVVVLGRDGDWARILIPGGVRVFVFGGLVEREEGGIYVVDSGKSGTKTPFLADIPLLGAAFRSRVIKDTRRELLIFVTPRIIMGTPSPTDL